MGRWLIGAGVALGLALLVVGVARSEVEPGRSETVQVVSSQKLPNVPGKSVSAVVVSYAPGGKSGKHHHAGSVLAYVLTGEIRSENSATGPAKVYKAGESFFEPPG
ncbi:MAG TPA: cupin domain-containing protein, partial [Methyloceanibacter sp.]|nr:cupin domain-containing protein [Methyloceanibacter sp.]